MVIKVAVFGQNADSLKNQLHKLKGAGRISVMLELAEMYTQSNADTSEHYYEKCFSEINSIDNLPLKIKVNCSYGLFTLDLGDLNTSYKYLRLADSLANPLSDLYLRGMVKNAIGNYYNSKGEFKEAIKLYLESAKLHEQSGNKEKIHEPYSNIGVIYANNGDYATARSYFFYAMNLIESVKGGDVEAIGKLFSNISLSYQYDKPDSAMVFIRKSLSYCEKNKLYTEFGNACLAMSNFYIDNGEPEQALAWVDRALQKYLTNKFTKGIGHAHYSKGLIYFAQKKFDKAITAFDSSIYYFKSIDDLHSLIPAYNYMAMSNENRGNYKKAIDYFRKYQALSDSVYTMDSEKNILQLEKQFNFDKKQKEIEILNKDNQLKNVTIQSDKATKRYYLIFIFLAIVLVIFVLISLFNKTKTNRLLKAKNEEIEKQKTEVEIQKEIISEKQKEILDSIHYAKRIQKALLPGEKLMERSINRLRKKP